MKIRNSFVSNSSSSSFVIATKDEDLYDILHEYLKQLQDQHFPFAKLMEDVFDKIISSAKKTTLEDLADNWSESIDEFLNRNNQANLIYYNNFYEGSFYSDDDGILLYDTDINFEIPGKIIMRHDGGY